MYSNPLPRSSFGGKYQSYYISYGQLEIGPLINFASVSSEMSHPVYKGKPQKSSSISGPRGEEGGGGGGGFEARPLRKKNFFLKL